MQLTAAVVGRDPWAVRLGGTVHVGRPVSAVQVVACLRELERATTAGEVRAAIETMLRWAFPIRWRNLWAGDPVRQILALPPDAQREVLRDFFGRRAGSPPARLPSPTSGSSWRH